jgi:hypothetical protein
MVDSSILVYFLSLILSISVLLFPIAILELLLDRTRLRLGIIIASRFSDGRRSTYLLSPSMSEGSFSMAALKLFHSLMMFLSIDCPWPWTSVIYRSKC